MEPYEIELSETEKKKIVKRLVSLQKERKIKNEISLRGKVIKGILRGKVLDIGSNNSIFFNEIKNKNTFGIDKFIDKNLMTSEEYGKIICCDAQQMAIKSGYFDCITAGEVIEHLEAPVRFLTEAYRVLKPEGLLIITTPNRDAWWNKLMKAYNHRFHKTIFTKTLIKAFLEKSGFSIIFFTTISYDKYSSPFGKAFFIRKLVGSMLPKNMGENMVVVAKKRCLIE